MKKKVEWKIPIAHTHTSVELQTQIMAENWASWPK